MAHMEGTIGYDMQHNVQVQRSHDTSGFSKVTLRKICWVNSVQFQRLTDMTWVGLSSTEEDARIYHFVHILVALRKSLSKLKTFYMDVANAGIPTLSQTDPHPRFFPHPTTFSQDNCTFHF